MADFPKIARLKADDETMDKFHSAARRGQIELIRRMLAPGPTQTNPNIANRFGCTALHLSCKNNQVACTRELAAVSDLSAAWHGQRPLQLAITSNNFQIAQMLIEGCKAQGRDVASFVSECDDFEIDEMAGLDRHCGGQTPLHWAVTARNVQMIQLLLDHGAHPCGKDKNGETVLMRAILLGFDDELELLLKVPGLRLEVWDKHLRTHLHWAVLENRADLAQQFMQSGHGIEFEDDEKRTPLSLASGAGMAELVEEMLEIADPFAIQSATFHNGTTVVPERIDWLPFATEEGKIEVAKVLQKKLDAIFGTQRGGTAKGKDRAQSPQMNLAPSAPVKNKLVPPTL